jgi:cellulose synthase/poly-beta-1,6-N-acetylglucosamine synthase-like glycosyltransferase
MAHAKNIAHRLAAGRIVCNVDADNFVSGDFTRYLVSLFAKFPRIVAHGVNIQSYWGRIALLNRWFQKLGGYDEKLGVRSRTEAVVKYLQK